MMREADSADSASKGSRAPGCPTRLAPARVRTPERASHLPTPSFTLLPLPHSPTRESLPPLSNTPHTAIMAEHDYRSAPTHPVSKRNDGSSHTPHCNSEVYKQLHEESVKNPDKFWDRVRRTFPSFPLAVALRGRVVRRGGVVQLAAPLAGGRDAFVEVHTAAQAQASTRLPRTVAWGEPQSESRATRRVGLDLRRALLLAPQLPRACGAVHLAF